MEQRRHERFPADLKIRLARGEGVVHNVSAGGEGLDHVAGERASLAAHDPAVLLPLAQHGTSARHVPLLSPQNRIVIPPTARQ